MFNYDGNAVAANRRKDASNPANQAMTESAAEAKLLGIQLEDMGFAELKLLLYLIDQRLTKILDADHNVTAETPEATLVARTVGDVQTALSGKTVYQMSAEELSQLIWAIDQGLTTPLLNSGHAMP